MLLQMNFRCDIAFGSAQKLDIQDGHEEWKRTYTTPERSYRIDLSDRFAPSEKGKLTYRMKLALFSNLGIEANANAFVGDPFNSAPAPVPLPAPALGLLAALSVLATIACPRRPRRF